MNSSARMLIGLVSALLLSGCGIHTHLTASPARVDAGQSVSLSWNIVPSAGFMPMSMEIRPKPGEISGLKGSVHVKPDKTTTYTLTAGYQLGQLQLFRTSTRVRVTVNPSVVNRTAPARAAGGKADNGPEGRSSG